MRSPAQRVLIYRLGSLGDTVVALPSLHLVARAFPTAERRLLTNLLQRVLHHSTDCGLETCFVEQKRCLTSIPVDDVLAQVDQALSRLPSCPLGPPQQALTGRCDDRNDDFEDLHHLCFLNLLPS